MSADILPIIRRFASALDAEDYTAAGELLAVDCVYHLRDEQITGAEAILDSYRSNGESARLRFQAIEYLSEVTPVDEFQATVDYTDRVCLAEEWHEFHCRQHLRVSDDGLIVEIIHEEQPGEREQLLAFEQRHAAD